MRKIIFRGSGPTVGMDYAHGVGFPDDVTEKQLSNEAWDYAVANAEMYGYYISYDECPDDDYDEEDRDCMIDPCAIDGWWEDYNGEDHDEIRCGGGSFEDDF